MTRDEFEKLFWNQYIMLEQEFLETLNYVEFDTSNFDTYSNKFAKLLLQVGSEMDNVFRAVCASQGRTTILDYANYVLTKYPNITGQNVRVKNSSIMLSPFNGWSVSQPSQSLLFWQKYNDVKHDRILKYKEASLDAVANGMADLFIIEMDELYELYKVETDTFESSPKEESKFFILENWTEHMRGSKVKLDNPLMDDEDGDLIG